MQIIAYAKNLSQLSSSAISSKSHHNTKKSEMFILWILIRKKTRKRFFYIALSRVFISSEAFRLTLIEKDHQKEMNNLLKAILKFCTTNQFLYIVLLLSSLKIKVSITSVILH